MIDRANNKSLPTHNSTFLSTYSPELSIKKVNSLNTRVSPFRKNLQSTILKTESKSKVFNMADELCYRKTRRMSQSATRLPPTNPEQKMSRVMKKITQQTCEVPEYTRQNIKLINWRKQLNQRIGNLKKFIAQEMKLKNEVSLESKRHMNLTEEIIQSTKKILTEINKIEFNLNITNQEAIQLKKQLDQLNNKIKSVNHDIQHQKIQINDLIVTCRNTKLEVISEQKKLNDLKASLSISQKAMHNNINYIKQLQNQKAVILLEIEKYYNQNRIRQ